MKKYISLLVLLMGASLSAQNPGTLNPEFSTNGWDTIYGHNNGFEVTRLLRQTDGKLLVCARANFASEGHQAVVVRYNINGTLDAGFGGGDGMIRSVEDLPENWEGEYLFTRAAGMALQSSGKIIIAGDQFYNTERLLRYNADGSWDTTFGVNGIVDMERNNGEFIYHVGVQSDDKIVVCGLEEKLVNGAFAKFVFVWRFLPNGALDNSFGLNGVAEYTTAEWANGETYLQIHDMIVLADNSILINQTYQGTLGNHVILHKMTANGAPDASFGTNGDFFKTDPNYSGVYTYSSSAIQPDGAIVSTFTPYDGDLQASNVLFRVNAQGVLDSSFNLTLPVVNAYETQKVMAQGNLIYVWNKDNFLGADFDKLWCYDTSGNVVTAFGGSGMVTVDGNDIPPSYQGMPMLSSDGRIFIASATPSTLTGDPNLLTLELSGAPLSVSKPVDAGTMLVYPNPANASLHIALPQGQRATSAALYDVMGKLVLQMENTTSLDLSGLAGGMYLLKVTLGTASYQQKIIRQ